VVDKTSTLGGKLSQMAMKELREETGDAAYRFIAVRLPYGRQADEKDGPIDAIAFMVQNERAYEFNIKSSVWMPWVSKALEETDISISDFVKGNV